MERPSCGAPHVFINNLAINVTATITNCSDVSFVDVCISHSNGTSLLIENTAGDVSLKNVTVKNNTLKKTDPSVDGGKSFAGGVFIYFDIFIVSSNYQIIDCAFEYITTSKFKSFDVRKVIDTVDWLGFGLGGGLSIIFDGNSAHNTFSIENCTFQYNFAPWGAGMCVRFQKNSAYNSVFIRNSNFKDCKAVLAGGGMDAGSAKRSLQLNNNTISVVNSTFRNNSADFGGGTYIFALSNSQTIEKGKFVNFHNCKWIENTALYSPAVDISPDRFDQLTYGALPIPVFQDCTFVRNKIQFKQLNVSRSTTSGVFVITRFRVSFAGTNYFDSNSYTALLLNSGQVVLEETLVFSLSTTLDFVEGQ